VKDLIVSIIQALIPPHEGENGLYPWRVAMSGLLLVTSLTLMAHVGYAAGWIPGTENERFVSRSELAQLSDVALTKAIYDSKKDQCSADPGSKARSTYAQIVAKFARQYKDLTGHEFDVPECDDL